MPNFKKDYLDVFLGVVRKYMQLRGALSQKDLAEILEVGVSTISRFLNQKVRDIDPQLVAKIVAKLNIPTHEVIDFIEEDYTERFIKLVKFFKEEDDRDEKDDTYFSNFQNSYLQGREGAGEGDDQRDKAGDSKPAHTATSAKIKIGGRTTSVPFGEAEKRGGVPHQKGIKEKLEDLSPRQKAYLSDFLNLDIEGRDLVVDVGNSLFRFFRQRRVEL